MASVIGNLSRTAGKMQTLRQQMSNTVIGLKMVNKFIKTADRKFVYLALNKHIFLNKR